MISLANLPSSAEKTEFDLVSSRVYNTRLEPDKQSWLGRKLKVFSGKSDLITKATIGDNQVYKNLKPGNESKFTEQDEKSGQVNTALIAETLHQFLINECKVESTRAENMVVDIMQNAAIDQTDVLNYVKYPEAFFVAFRGINPQGTFKGTFTNSFTWNNGQLKFESHNYYPLLDADLNDLNKRLDVGYFVTVPQDTHQGTHIQMKTMTSTI